MCLTIPGQVFSISGDDPIMRAGRVDFGGVAKEINFAFVPEVRVGDYVLVHVGFALLDYRRGRGRTRLRANCAISAFWQMKKISGHDDQNDCHDPF